MPKMVVASLVTAGLSMLGMINSLAVCEAERPSHKAILLVAFGTAVPAAQKAFKDIDSQAQRAFPGVAIHWAYTSKIIRRILAQRGEPVDSPELALAKLMDQGVTHVAVQALQMVPGIEFHELNQNAKLFGQMSGGFQRIEVAAPLLSSDADMERVVDALLQRIPPDRQPGDGVIWMGHGTAHPADAMYAAMNYFFQRRDVNVHVATVAGYLDLAKILPTLRQRKVTKVYLLPLLTVAGDHVRNDMAGAKPDSWVSILSRQGYTCVPIMQGLGEYPEIVAIWLDQLHKAFAKL